MRILATLALLCVVLNTAAVALSLTAATAATAEHSRRFAERFPAPYAVPGLTRDPTLIDARTHVHTEVGSMEKPKRRWSVRSPSNVYLGILQKAKLVRDPDLARLIARVATAFSYAMLVVTAMGTLGIDTKPLISVFGITGFTLGFGLKDIMYVRYTAENDGINSFTAHNTFYMVSSANSFAGVQLVISRPFHTGNYIQVASYEGQVTEIDHRYVHLRQHDGSAVLVPACTVLASPIVIRSHGSVGGKAWSDKPSTSSAGDAQYSS